MEENKHETKVIRIRKTDDDRLDDVQMMIAFERKQIKTKIDTITILLDEFFEKRNGKTEYRNATQEEIDNGLAEYRIVHIPKSSESLDDEKNKGKE